MPHTSRRPVSPRLHGLIDYGFLAGNLLLPALLRLPQGPRRTFQAFGLVQGSLNAVTAPYGLLPEVPFALHGRIEKSSGVLYLGVPLLTGVLRDRRSVVYWVAAGVALVTVYNLTDWGAPTGPRR